MKKLILTLMLVITASLQALPVGNPSEASMLHQGLFLDDCSCIPCGEFFSLRGGFYGNYVSNRHLKVHGGIANNHELKETEISTNAGYLALNFCNLFDVFTSLGQSKCQMFLDNFIITTDAAVPDDPGTFLSSVYFDPSFSWSVGARSTLWEWGCLSIGAEGEYFQSKMGVNQYFFEEFATFYTNDRSSTYREWQVGLGASYRIENSSNIAFIPYAAIKWARAQFDHVPAELINAFTPQIFSIPSLRTSRHIGCALGTSFTLSECAAVTVEGRFGDEKAIYVNGQVRF